MPADTKEFKIRAKLAGLEEIPGKLAHAVELGLRVGVREGGIADIATAMTGGILEFGKRAKKGAEAAGTAVVPKAAVPTTVVEEKPKEQPMSGMAAMLGLTRNIGPVANKAAKDAGAGPGPLGNIVSSTLGGGGGGAEGGEGATAEGGAAGAGAAGGAAMAAGPVAGALVGVNILQHIAGILEGLAPIKAILTVVKAILELVFMPLAMVLMAILMPFLLPLLQIMQKFPWQQFFAVTQQISKYISEGLNDIWNAILWMAGGIMTIWNTGVAVLTTIWNAIVQVGQWITTGFDDIYNVFSMAYQGIVGVLDSLWAVLQAVWNFFVGAEIAMLTTIADAVRDVWNVITGVYNWFVGTMGALWNDIRTIVNGVWSALQTVWGWYQTYLQPVFDAISDGIHMVVSVLQAIGNALGNMNPANWSLPSFDVGGYVSQDMVAQVHAGETVVPAGGGNKGPVGDTYNVTITGNTISSHLDIQNLANQVATQISNTKRRLSTW